MFQFLYILMLWLWGTGNTEEKKKKGTPSSCLIQCLGIKRRVTDIKRKGAE